MNDCFWGAMGACVESCRCEKYLSMNSEEGDIIGGKWDERVHVTLEPVIKEFAKENGFEEVQK